MWETDLLWVWVECFAPECNFDPTWPFFTEKKKIILRQFSEDIAEDQNFISNPISDENTHEGVPSKYQSENRKF